MKKQNTPEKKEWSFKDLMRQAFVGGIWVGLIFAGGTLLENLSPNGSNTINDVIRNGVFGFLLLPVIFIIGLLVTKYVVPWMTGRRLRTARYKFLHDNGFVVDEKFCFKGVYRGYHIKIIPIEDEPHNGKYISYDIIESYYDLSDQEINENILSGNYYFGHITFESCKVILIPRNYSNPDFEETLNGLVTVLTREKLEPRSQTDWEETFGKTNPEHPEE